MIGDPQDLSLLSSRGIMGKFYESLEQSNENNWAMKVGFEITSNQESETHNWLGQSPIMREWTGGRQAKGIRGQGVTIINKEFEASLVIKKKDLRRDKTGQIQIRISEMADRTSSHWVELVSALSTTNGTSYDGQNFFSASHSEGRSGTQINLLTSSEVSELNVTTAASPTALEMAEAIIGCIEKFFGFKDDQAQPINENARSFMVVTPVGLWSPTAKAITQRLLSSGTGTLDNPITNMGLSIQHVVDARLDADSSVKFYIYRLDGRAKPYILQSEVGVETQVLAEGSEEDVKNNQWFFGVTATRNAGYGLWQHALSCELS